MNKTGKKIDLLLAIVLNIVFLMFYMCRFPLLHDANDDLAISFLAEGAFGTRSEYLVFQNILWGKLLVGLYQILPQFKWYNILLYAAMFFSFSGLSYVFFRKLGRKVGLAVNLILLVFGGYHFYVIFQFSRVAAITVIAGMMMLFLAVEDAESKGERAIYFICGLLLAIWGSMLRFQVFALATVLTGGAIGLHRVWKIVREKKEDWRKQLTVYVIIFGTTAVLCCGLYVVDRLHYELDEQWSAYTEFNESRAALWDYGLPPYEENMELYESLNISQNDFWYYICWNMDANYIDTETIQTILAAKETKSFSIVDYLKEYPRSFLTINLFVLYIVIAVMMVGVNRKNLFFALYGFVMVMIFEAYFFNTGRYAIPRIDYGMWMAAIVGLLYAVTDDLKKLQERSWQWMIALMLSVSIIAVADFGNVQQRCYGFASNTYRDFYTEVSQDKEHLYVMLQHAPSVYFSRNFWEPYQEGELSNVYNAFGWEWNIDGKDDLLANYNVTDIYKDAINNNQIYFVVGETYEIFLHYIQEHYALDAELVCEKYVQGIPVFSIKASE